MDMGVLFEHLDGVRRRESPLTPIRSELDADPSYVERTDSCPRDGCPGSLWDGPDAGPICDHCSMILDGTRSVSIEREDEWTDFWDHRPRYSRSNRVRLAGSFDLDWLEESDTDRPISSIPADSFYVDE